METTRPFLCAALFVVGAFAVPAKIPACDPADWKVERLREGKPVRIAVGDLDLEVPFALSGVQRVPGAPVGDRSERASSDPSEAAYFQLERLVGKGRSASADVRFFQDAGTWSRSLCEAASSPRNGALRDLAVESARFRASEGPAPFAERLDPHRNLEPIRKGAAWVLGMAYGDAGAEILGKAALSDPSRQVRLAAAEAIRDGTGRTPEPVLAVLAGDDPRRVSAAAEAVEVIRDRKGIGALVSALVSKTGWTGSGGSARCNLTVIQERAYVRDVATLVSSGIGGAAGIDPEIGTIREGTAFEVKATAIRTLRTTWYRITGNRFRSVREIEEWWAEHQHEF